MKTIRWLDRHLEECLLVLIGSIMVLSVSMQVLVRFIFGGSIDGVEEFTRYGFIWLIYIGISYAAKKQRHLKVDVLLLVLKNKAKVVLGMVSNMIFLAFAVFIIFYGSSISFLILDWGQVSPALNFPVGWVYLAAPAGMGLTSMRLLQVLVKQGEYLVSKDIAVEDVSADRSLDGIGSKKR